MRAGPRMNHADRVPGLPAPDRSTGRDPGPVARTQDGQGRRPQLPVLRQGSLLRTAFGAALFVAWAIGTIVWVASALDSLAARQLFVALIVTAATLLANRSVIVIPGTSVRITDSFVLAIFDLVWTTLTVLWFAQIFPKHLGAINPDRYIHCLRRPLFPVVGFVHKVGISQPGEWAADVVEVWLNWAASPEAAKQRPSDEHSHAAIWRQLRTGDNAQRTPEGGGRD